jgi:chromosome partitioning protein
MKTIALANMKGGTGKASISVSLAAELAKTSQTVLLDFDGQGNTTAWTAPDDADMKAELADVLNGKTKTQARDAIIHTDTEGLDLLPTFGIGGELRNYVDQTDTLYVINAVDDLLKDIGRMGYQYCIIDLSPSFGRIEKAALIAADEVVTPLLADRFSLDGLEAIAENLKELHNMARRPIAEYKRIILNGIDKRIKRHSQIIDRVKSEMKQKIYCIPVDQAFFRAQVSSRTLQSMDAKKETLETISLLANDIRENK